MQVCISETWNIHNYIGFDDILVKVFCDNESSYNLFVTNKCYDPSHTSNYIVVNVPNVFKILSNVLIFSVCYVIWENHTCWTKKLIRIVAYMCPFRIRCITNLVSRKTSH